MIDPESKKLVGAWFEPALRAGIDTWLARHPGVTQSHFIILACIEKLQSEGIQVDQAEALRDRRARLPFKEQAAKNISYLKSVRKHPPKP